VVLNCKTVVVVLDIQFVVLDRQICGSKKLILWFHIPDLWFCKSNLWVGTSKMRFPIANPSSKMEFCGSANQIVVLQIK